MCALFDVGNSRPRAGWMPQCSKVKALPASKAYLSLTSALSGGRKSPTNMSSHMLSRSSELGTGSLFEHITGHQAGLTVVRVLEHIILMSLNHSDEMN